MNNENIGTSWTLCLVSIINIYNLVNISSKLLSLPAQQLNTDLWQLLQGRLQRQVWTLKHTLWRWCTWPDYRQATKKKYGTSRRCNHSLNAILYFLNPSKKRAGRRALFLFLARYADRNWNVFWRFVWKPQTSWNRSSFSWKSPCRSAPQKIQTFSNCQILSGMLHL